MSDNPRRRRSPVRLCVGHFFGVPVYFAPSWLLIAGLLTFYYGPVVDDSANGVTAGPGYAWAFCFAVLFALCVLAHELGHTAVCLVLGQPVRRVVIFLLGGVSEIDEEPRRPRDEFLIAAAGPAVSALLAGATGVALILVDANSVIGVLLALLFWSNLIVAVFNLIPGLPLDGGRLLRAGVWAVARSRLTGTRAGAWSGRVVAVCVGVLGVYANTRAGSVTTGALSLVMAAYLWVGATQSLRVAEIMSKVPGVDLRPLLRPGLLVDGSLPVAEAARRAWALQARALVVVGTDGSPAAIVDEARVRGMAADERDRVTCGSIARPIEAGMRLPSDLSGDKLLAAVRRTPASEYLAVDRNGAPAGVLAAVDLAAALEPGDARIWQP